VDVVAPRQSRGMDRETTRPFFFSLNDFFRVTRALAQVVDLASSLDADFQCHS